MGLRPLALALTLGFLGALFMLFATFYPPVSEALLGQPYGEAWRALMMNTYPWYSYEVWYGVVLGMVFGFIDGFVLGGLIGVLYNAFARE